MNDFIIKFFNLYFVLKKVKELSLDIETSLHLFDAMITPILTYGSDIWGYGNLRLIEKVQLNFCKYILKLKRSTPNVMVYGELGRFPIEIAMKVKIIKFWGSLISNENKLSSKMYHILYSKHVNMISDSQWLTSIQNILENCGLGYFWINQTCHNPNYLGELVKRRLQDQYMQLWNAENWRLSKTNIYRSFKIDHGFEQYLNMLSDSNRIPLCKFRCGNHRLPVETGRWYGIDRQHRTCDKCDSNTIGDEFHFVLQCKFYQNLRSELIPRFYWTRPNMLKYNQLFTSKKRKTIINLSQFIKKANVL